MKGIILAGGSGTRLYPTTKVISKQLLPIYNKPTIYYPLSLLISSHIRDIIIISTPQTQPLFEDLLGNGEELGLKIKYLAQSKPNGIAESFIIAEPLIQNTPTCLVLGDNIFYGEQMHKLCLDAQIQVKTQNKGVIFGYHVKDPEKYGVAEFNENMKVVSIEEKPFIPKSNYAVTGLYFYPSDVVEKAKSLTPSKRGELEITDLNMLYLNEDRLDLQIFGASCAWLDTGTHDSMITASQFVQTLEQRQNLLIGAIEYEAYKAGFIDKQQFHKLAEKNSSSSYGGQLFNMLKL
ncbi:glucose-1-phosphate thymidylyltransferase RfbA [Rickettsiales endosymbiont of Stachyamoeba lipophora]|uniref:glucose-1-phosphate thymidylyltransferase RfbA n=1 Tax=Rickettsiales endosymbiont of Stachyamoeba lipophora TaxID=2486578 RepID=UPI000F64C533|nr:glucose-1-phosphate thymidylyltransferase RfbA [Rickettsiales endosymbiont of Stachyamoeba lipophora]AZL15695.1 glucose-1-phosphate thymidylyltransferase [Rickettsiales endosymbiont of Stachyamoeba lipophora]